MSITDGSLRAGFLKQVALRPDAPAVVVKNRVLTYGMLDETARRWAGAVVGRLGGPATRVGVFGARSELSFAGVLAALYSGAAFVPLNPRYPAERTRTMIRRAGLDAIFVDAFASRQLAAVLDGLENPPPIWLPDGANAAELASAQPLNGELPPLPPEHLAYLLFTSGSTGVPKGVPILQSNIRAYVDWAVNRFQIQPSDRFSQTFNHTFDASIFDLFVAWSAGACIYVLSPVDLLAPSGFINKNELTVWFSVPSIPAQMRKRGLLKPNSLPTLRWSLFSGEPLPRASAEAWQAAAANSIVENLYGPTEVTITCTTHRWNPATSPELCVNDMTPIGIPYPGLTAVLVDEQLRIVPEGQPGELCLCGAQTSPGYWQNPALTAERFVKLHADGLPDEIFYRTGDLARKLPNGEYVCLGRTDHQIKVLGFRVELGEIEGAMLTCRGVVQAVAMGWPVSEGTAQGIVAFVSGAEIDTLEVLNACKASLADYMVPSKIISMDSMPLNANGKVDRGALKMLLESGAVLG
jgi:amino acid adenylation domain-containing protein